MNTYDVYVRLVGGNPWKYEWRVVQARDPTAAIDKALRMHDVARCVLCRKSYEKAC